MANPAETLYPELGAGGFTHVDGTVEFYQRINALVTAHSVVADIGAGRGKFAQDDPVAYRRDLRHLRGRVSRVIGLDVDPVVTENPAVDEAYVIGTDGRLPLEDSSVDLVISDFTFEHVTDPGTFSAEVARVLRPSGWVCARTPNKWGYVGLGARAVPNRFHNRALRSLQPHKKSIDTFDVAYRLNSRRALLEHFPPNNFDHFVYTMNNEPAYFASSLFAWRVAKGLFQVLPENLGAIYYVFLRKRDGTPNP